MRERYELLVVRDMFGKDWHPVFKTESLMLARLNPTPDPYGYGIKLVTYQVEDDGSEAVVKTEML